MSSAGDHVLSSFALQCVLMVCILMPRFCCNSISIAATIGIIFSVACVISKFKVCTEVLQPFQRTAAAVSIMLVLGLRETSIGLDSYTRCGIF